MIKEFIRTQIILPRLKQCEAFVVYDPERRYRDLCLEMASAATRVVDASDSGILSREEALMALQELGKPAHQRTLEHLLIYVPAPAPRSDNDRMRDPFALYAVCGGMFPDGDGDEYLSLCLKAKPDYNTDIRRIFSEHPNPPFAVIDAIGGGAGWPVLQTLLRVESARDLLFALLAPSDEQKTALNGQESWVAEARELCATSLGLNLLTRAKAYSALADELWRFLLFSEFAFDLPDALPASLANVPRAQDAARPLVEDLCERLRNDRRTQAAYIDRAETIQSQHELDLPAHCNGIENFGERDTFPFEERWFLSQAIDKICQDDPDAARQIVERHANSVWSGTGESQAQWGVIRAALELNDACDDAERQFSDSTRSLAALLEWYLRTLRETDRLQRQFEQAASDAVAASALFEEMLRQSRRRYARLTAKVQEAFIRHVETSGWPPAGQLANADVFDALIAPKLQESGRRVAFFMVDALRYELGVALKQQLDDDGQVELRAACAQLPSVTTVGMASLLPEAGHALSVQHVGDSIVPMLGEQPISTVPQRMEALRQRYGSRFADITLSDLLHSKKALPGTVDLLVIRSTEIDAQLETAPETALNALHDTLRRIRAAIRALADKGFHEIVIAADHGFFLNMQAEAGDVCAKPAGNWLTIHERLLLGNGQGDAANFALPAPQLGIRGNIPCVAGPRRLIPYRAGELYLHGGVSLQECVVPVITMKTRHARPSQQPPAVSLSYKRGETRITTRLPVVDVQLAAADLFSTTTDFELLLEAHDARGNVVGEARPGGIVNPATGTLTLKPGQPAQVVLRMQLEFEGKFTVKAINPTTLATYCALNLETDYAV